MDICLIFLDIDGVLYNPWDPSEQLINFLVSLTHEQRVARFDKKALDNLELLIRNITLGTGKNVGIVLTSTWRMHGNMDFIRKLFKQHFFANFLIDVTPVIDIHKRGLEISTWIDTNKNKINIHNFVILDDCAGIGLESFGEQFIQCNEKTLFSEKELELALNKILFLK